MTAIELLALLNEQGISLSVDGADLRVSAPKGGLTPELRDALVANKAELIALLGRPQDNSEQIELGGYRCRADDSALPLSFAQERLWFLDQLEPGSTLYNVPTAIRLHGTPDRVALARALQRLSERHEALRCRFETVNRQPVAVLQSATLPEIAEIDARDLNDTDLAAKLTALTNETLDLSTGELFRATLLQTTGDEFILLLVVHHIATDGASFGILMNEWAALYGEETGGSAAHLPELPLRYADFAGWQREQLADTALEHHLGYWREQLSGAPLQLDMPTDKARPLAPERRGGWVSEVFDPALLQQLQEVARANQSTLYMVLLAAFNVLLYRYSRQDDILLGTPVAGRQETATENLVGLFVNSVVIRSQIDEEQRFSDLLSAVNTHSLDALNHQALPFEKLVEEFQPERDAAVAPIFQVMFNLQNREHETVAFADLRTSPVVVETGTAKFDLSVLMEDRSDGLAAWFEYSTDLYDETSIVRMLGHYRQLLESIAAQPDTAIANLTLLDDLERARLEDWNATAVSYPQEATLVSLFEAQVARTPDAPAVTFADETLSYTELNARANKLARYLQQHGVMAETPVGVCMERSLDMVVALYAVLKAGGAYVPLDPEYPQQRLAHMLEDAAINVILSQTHLQDCLPENSANLINTNMGWAAIAIKDCPDDNLPPLAQPEGAAYVIFTSGSTGRPKGVLNEHRGIVNRLLWMQDEYSLTPDDRILQKTPYSFDVSVWEFFWPLQTGAHLVVAEPGGHKDTGYLTNVVREHGITTLHFVPSMLRSFLEDPQARECTSLSRVICSGEALPVDLVENFYSQLDAGLHNLYGPTEAAIDVSYHACSRDTAGASVPIGRPVANTQIHIVDAAGNLCPAGIPGELLIGGVQVARGYVNRPELTEERFIADYISGTDGARLYRTGDLARFRSDGIIEFLGRIDFQVKLRGFRIELGEIEAALQSIAGVSSTAVVLHEDQTGEQRLAAYFVSSDSAITTDRLRTELGDQLPDYMVPAAFIPLQELPLTASGKLDRKALPAPDWSLANTVEYVPPRTPEEEALCEIWADLLGLERVGIHDDFFLSGGHSLLATRVVARIRDTLRKELTLKAIFDRPTIAELGIALTQADATDYSPIAPRSTDAAVPLSASQQRLWILDRIDPGESVYNIPWATRLRGELNTSALQSAINILVARHESLRTRFVATDNDPVQIITPELTLALQTEDCAGADLRERLGELTGRAFDLTEGPLICFTLLRLATDEHVLHVNMHHIIGDAWSTDVLRRELTALYNAEVANSTADLPPLSVQYGDYANWQRERLQSEALRKSCDWWREQLAGAPAVLNLPTDFPRPQVQTHKGAWLEMRLDEELSAALKKLAGDNDATLYMVLLTAFNLLLARHSGQDDIVIGSHVAGRRQAELDNLIGFFINTLAIRTRVDETLSFNALLEQVKDTALNAYANQEVPFERLVEELQPDRDTAYPPIFQVVFILQNAPQSPAPMTGIESSAELFDFGTAKFDLTLSMEEDDGELVGYFEYNTDLFAASTMAAMAERFRLLLDGVARAPATPLQSIDLLPANETRQLERWNQTGREYDTEATLPELIAAQVERTPAATALQFGETEVSYSEFNARANQLAHWLIAQGVKPDSKVGVYMERSIDLVVALHAIVKAGGAYVPLDPEYPPQRLQHMLEDACPELVLADVPAAQLDGFTATVHCVADLASELASQPNNNPAVELQPDDLAYVIFTSGSTGRPKGVMNEHRGIVNRLLWMQDEYRLQADDTVLQKTPFSFDVSVWEFFWPLLSGAKLLIAEPGGHRDPDYLRRTIIDNDVTTLHFVPSMLQVFLQHPEVRNCTSLRRVICSGEALPIDLQERCLQLLDAGLHNLYGPTEAAVDVTYWRCSSEADASTVPIGHPVANTQIYIVDSSGRRVPPGVPGELWIGGVQVARGYINRPELTAERFIADPFSSDAEARVYRTGDLARFRDDGRIEFLGRIDHQVKMRGLRIELGEIEAALAERPDIEQCVTLLREDRPGDQHLVAYCIAAELPDTETLRTELRATLPDYMVPTAFVRLDEMPLTASGKVDRKLLPAPELQAEQEYIAPRSELEERLAEIWGDILGVEQPGVFDDFFQSGGHSLLATRLGSRVLAETGLELPLAALFNNPTIAGIARELAAATEDGHTALVAVDRSQPLPLSFAQQRLWFLDELSPGNPMYNVPWVMELRGDPDRPALQAAIDQLVARHESLRTVFPSREGEAVQIILPECAVPLHEEDLCGADEEAIQQRVTELAQQRMNLAGGPLSWFTLLRIDEERYLLVLVIHHIIFDAWSNNLLINELAANYNANLRGKAQNLPPLPIEFGDYAVWQREWFESDDFQRQLDYWTTKLADAPTTLDLPTDRPRPAVQSSNGANLARMLPQNIHDGIKQLCEDQGVSLFMTTLTAFNILMARYSGQNDLLVGTPISGRKRSELEDIIGFFLHTLVIRAELEDNPTFTEALDQTRRSVLEAFEHQELPFETLVEALGTERDTSRHPLFQVHFVLQHVDIDWGMFDGLDSGPFEFDFGTAKFDIMFFVFDTNDSLSVKVEYNTDLFDRSTIDRLIDHFETLLNGIITNPNEQVGKLPILPEQERNKLLVEWNETDFAYPVGQTMHGKFEATVVEQPDAPALWHDNTELSYRELNRRANKLAGELRLHGVGPEILAAVCSERCPEMIIAMLAIQKAGGAYVPIDPEYPPQRVAHMLNDSAAPVLLSQSQLLERLPEHDAVVICLDEFDWTTDASHDSNIDSGVNDANLGYVIYTSGSTGLPKGVEIEHRNAVALIEWAGESFSRDEFAGVLASTSICFDLSVYEIFVPLGHGGRLVLVKDALALPELDSSANVTLINSVPSAMAELVRIKGVPESVRTVNLAGEPLSTALVNSIYELGMVKQVNDLYGPSEDTTYSTWTRREANALPTIGRPLSNTQAYVLDPYGEPVPTGVPGELFLAGAGVTRGYRNRPELTAQRYVSNPFDVSADNRNQRMYRTGDKVRYDNSGQLQFMGRLDHQVKLRGFRIELGEIETALASHPAVENTVVMAREDREGDPRLVAYIVASTDGLKGEELEQWEAEQVNQWQDLWQEAYNADSETDDLALDFKGWNSSYTGEPIPHEQMLDWLHNTASRIRATNPQNVLEIGSGTGLIVGQVAPHVAHYTATDFSAASINALEALRTSRSEFANLELRQCKADEIDTFPEQAFDTVVLNSVAQYFPDIDYLRHFIAAATDRLQDGGHIFLGDLRSTPLLEAYHASVQMHQADDHLPISELAEQVRLRTEQEEELLIDPAFFIALQQELPAISGIRYQIKRSRYRNELTRFRYDVTLEINGDTTLAVPEHVDWNSAGLTLDSLREHLQTGGEILITAIPDARLGEEAYALAELAHPDDRSSNELRTAAAAQTPGIEPEDLYALAEELGRDLQLTGTLPGQMSALFSSTATPRFDGALLHNARPVPWRDYGNDPLHGRLQRSLVPILREKLAVAVPDYMMPSAFVIMDAFPLTPNGKINRKALPAPERKRSEQEVYVAPRTPVEETLADIWSQVLGVKQIGVYDDFFALGGHSLLATQLVSRIRDRLDTELPLLTLFNEPTIAGLATTIEHSATLSAAPPLTPRDRGSELPLSFAQQRLWFLAELEGSSATYNMPLALRLEGRIDLGALQQAVDTLVARHEALRTCFVSAAGKPVQVISDDISIAVDVIGLTGADDETVLNKVEELTQRSFDLTGEPLLRVHLIRGDDDRNVLLLLMHHIVSDGWSLSVLARELGTVYRACCSDTTADLPALSVQYADYAIWQREWLSGDELQRQLDYWREHLSSAPALLQLPTDRPRPPVQTFNGSHTNRTLPPELTSSLRDLADDAECTLFMLLLGGWATLLSRYSGSDDIVVGSPIAGRTRTELEDLIGFFVNTLALRVQPEAELSFNQLLEQVRQTALGAFSHQEMPFEKLVEELQPERDTSHSPIFQTLFVLQENLVDAIDFHDLDARLIDFELGTAKFDLSLFMVEFEGELIASLEYNSDLFDRATAERILQQLEVLLSAVAANPELPLARLPLLDDADRQAATETGNVPYADLPADRVHERVEAVVAQHPDRIALEQDDAQISYAELNRRANRLAHALINKGAGPGDPVAICAQRSIEQIISVLAVLKSGAAYVPVDPTYPAERVGFMLADCRARILLTDNDEQAAAGADNNTQVIRIDGFEWQHGNADNPAARGESVYVIYTSGSTGKPKGVELTHSGLSNLISWQHTQPGLDQPARTLQFASLSFDVSFQELFSTWAQGGTVVMVSEECRRDMPQLARHISTRSIERLYLPFAALQPLAETLASDPELRPVLQDVISAGEQLLVTPAIRQLYSKLDDARLHNQYGPSETHVVTACTLDGDPQEWPGLPTIGTPVSNTRVYVLDTNGEPLPPGVPGELYLSGVQTARGYIGRDELTAEKFLPDPFVELDSNGHRARMYRTGDRVRWRNDGELDYLGRTDDQVKWRGFRIEPGEIETCLATHAAIRQASVIIREDAPGDKRLVAYVVGNEEFDAAQIRSWLQERLPDYMVPSVFMSLDALPLTPSGKVARRQLPAPDYAEVQQRYVAPRTPEEETLALIWADVLGIEKVGAEDDFFALGGHSLLATQLLARVRDTFGVEMPLVSLFAAPRVDAFAAKVAAERGAPVLPPLLPAERNTALPLSFAQQRLWFLDQLEPGNPVYNIPWAMRLHGQLNPDALQASLDDIVRRHESLRTVFTARLGQAEQQILDKLQVPVQYGDATALSNDELHKQLRSLAREPFSLEQAPLLRVHLLQTAADEHVLLLVMHHIISDGWSIGVLYKEFVELYSGHCRGEPQQPAALPVQYADYAVWQQQQAAANRLDDELEYWKQRLKGAPAVLELPLDRPRGATQTFNGGFVEQLLPNAIHEGLQQLAREHNATLFMVCLTAFKLLLSRYSGQQDICVGAPIAGRQHSELDEMVGFFINSLVLRTDLSDSTDFIDCLQRVRSTSLDAFSHQQLPFEKLVDELHPVRDMSHAPLFQTAFILQNTPWDQQAELPNLTLEPIELEFGVAKFDLSLIMAERREGLLMQLEFNSDLFDRSTIERMAGHFQTLLLGIVSNPRLPVTQLPLLTAGERELVLETWNDTAVPYADDTCIHTLIERRTTAQPDAPAILFGDTTLSFAELNSRANRIAHLLRARGAGPGSIVGLCMDRSPDLVAGLLGVFKAGAAYVPLDPSYPADRLEWMLTDSAARQILTHSSLRDELPPHDAECLCLDQLDDELQCASDTNPESLTGPDDLAWVIYTSGSTGKPKGVMIEHRGACNLADAQARAFGLGPGDRMLQFASISFDASIFEIIMGLQVGAAMVLAPKDELLPGPALLQVLEQHRVTAVTLPPTALSQLPSTDLPHLQTITVAGEACPPELVSNWAPGRRFFNLYGPTESTVWASYEQCEAGAPITIGGPITNARLYILDANLQPAPVGVPGELCIGGAGLARGYLNRPELSAEKFLDDPFRDDDARIYRSGDLVRFLPDGRIEFLGRIDHQVKVRGFRIELGEVEAALTAHPGIRESVAMARGEGIDQRLIAYVVAEPEHQPELQELRRHLQGIVPEFMIPAAFVVLDEFPLTPNRKVDRKALPDPDESASGKMAISSEYAAPRNNREQILADIWQTVLKTQKVGVHDNFFELGGDSILSIQIIARAARENIRLTPRQLFSYQTIAELAEAAATGQSSAEQGQITGPVRLTPVQHWFAARHVIEPEHFNQSQVFEADRPLSPECLEKALHTVTQHHDALRLTVSESESGWQQAQGEQCNGMLLRTVHLDGLDPAEHGKHELALANALQSDIDLQRGPLCRALLFRRGHDLPDRLLLVIHHMAVDWVSWSILMEDLQAAYLAHEQGEQPELPPKTTSFRQWSEQLHAYANSDELRTELEYWQTQDWQCAGQIPVDNPDGNNTVGDTISVSRRLEVAETRALQTELPRRWRTQINTVLLTAVSNALTQWSGSEAALIDLEGHGREDIFDDIDLSRTVGWFTSLYPVLLQPAADTEGLTDEQQTIASMRAIGQQLEAIPQRGIGYGVLRYLASSARTRAAMAKIPVPQVAFNYLGLLDSDAGDTGLLTTSFAARGAEQSPRQERSHLLDIAVGIAEDRLQLSLNFSSNRFDTTTIEQLADAITAQLEALVATADSDTATTADFPLANVDQALLDELLATGPVDDIYPVTALQHGMIFHSLLGNERDVYFARFRWRLSGELNAALFDSAWQQVIARHSSLRTAFRWENIDPPLQIVRRSIAATLQQQDWSDLDAGQQKQRLSELLAADQDQRFDLTNAPLMRLQLIRLAPDDHHFVWSFHHSIIDGWSVPRVLGEVFAIYDAERQGMQHELPAAPAYTDYLNWLNAQDNYAAEHFWRERLAGFSSPTPLPAARLQSLPAGVEPDFTELQLRIDADLVTELRRLAQGARLTLNTVVQGIWSLLLSRYSGEDDILFGGTTSGRPAELPDVGGMVGLFLNTLPVRIRIDSEQPLLEWLRQLQEEQLEARQHEFASLVQVQNWSEIPRGTAMFSSLLAFENYPDMETMWTDTDSIRISEMEGFDRTNYPLTVNVAAFDELLMRLVYDNHMFTDSAIERLGSHFEALLRALVADAERQVGELPLLVADERQYLLEELNATAVSYPAEATLQSLFESQVAATPDAAALVAGDSTLSYGELNECANRLAHLLIAEGVSPETPVGVYMQRSADMVIALYAITKAGGAYVPLDPEYPQQRLQHMLEDADLQLILTHGQAGAELPDNNARVLDIDEITADLEKQSTENPPCRATADNAAYIIFTSGSTGRPKGVVNEHRGIVNRLLWMQDEYGLSADDRVLQKTPFSFDVSVWEFFWPLQTGACLVVADAGGHRDAGYLAQLISEQKITTLHFVPSMLQVFLQHPEAAGCTSLQRIICSGEALSHDLQKRCFELLPAELHNLYGPTEAAVDVSYWACQRDSDETTVPIGRPVANTRLYIVQPNGEPAPTGVAGELWIGGVQVARGYINRPELTAERFIADPFSAVESARVYRTGDLARLREDGAIEFLGRIDHQVKLRGLRIELGEIEAVIDTAAFVKQSLVAVLEPRPGDQQLVAYVQLATATGDWQQELQQIIADNLPEYMMPAAFVQLESFPLLPNGKVDRKRLPTPEWTTDTEFVPPRNETEEQLAAIWTELLGIDQVGVHDDFFALGGHSLVAMQVVSRILERMQVNMPLDRLFAAPTLAALAESVNESRDSGAELTDIGPITRTARRKRRKSRKKE